MKQLNASARTSRIYSSSATLAALLAISLALGLMPSTLTQGVRDGWGEGLRPALVAWDAAAGWVQDRWQMFRSGDDPRLQQAQQQIVELTQQLQRLEIQFQLANNDRPGPPSDETQVGAQSSPLLLGQCITARVLGRQAKAFLQSRELLDIGRSRGVAAQSLVIDDAAETGKPVVDQGRNATVEPGRLVLAGRRVWGKVAHVGPHTSTVQRSNDAGYRDLVRLASQRDGRWQYAARGVLVGRGEALCKIELVETTEPITVGDLVFTSDDGVLQTPLLYGRVARLERKPGAAHWEIWMEPAVASSSPPAQVAVLRMELNPARLAIAGSQEPGVRSH